MLACGCRYRCSVQHTTHRKTNSIPGLKGITYKKETPSLSAFRSTRRSTRKTYTKGVQWAHVRVRRSFTYPQQGAQARMHAGRRTGDSRTREEKKNRRGKETRHRGRRATESAGAATPAAGARAWCKEQVYRVVKLVCKGVSGFVMAVVGARRRHGRAGRVRVRVGLLYKTGR
jgi:hypothetical protein